MATSKDKTPSAVKLNGFAPAAGSGAGASSISAPAAAPLPTPVGAAATAVAAAAGGGGGTPLTEAALQSSKKPATTAATAAKRPKKRGPKKGAASATATASENDSNLADETTLRPLSDINSTAFEPMSLPQIKLRLKGVLDKLPKDLPPAPPVYDVTTSEAENAKHYAPIKSFAATLQIAIEEYNLFLSLVSAATYKWGVDRSGASQQNLSVMSAELQQCQEVISNVISARLSNVLCPAVEPLIGEVEIIRAGDGGDDGAKASATPAKKRKLNGGNRLSDKTTASSSSSNERRINHFIRPLVDPSYVHLCHCILARNGKLMRHTLATSIYTAQQVIGDYLKAMTKDSSHDAGKGGYY